MVKPLYQKGWRVFNFHFSLQYGIFVREERLMEIKKVSISAKRQITIPQRFFQALGFDSEAECVLRGNELVIRPVKTNSGGEFAEQILADLVAQGYSGKELLEKFRETQRKIRPAVEAILTEAEQAADGTVEYSSYDEIFGEVEHDS